MIQNFLQRISLYGCEKDHTYWALVPVGVDFENRILNGFSTPRSEIAVAPLRARNNGNQLPISVDSEASNGICAFIHPRKEGKETRLCWRLIGSQARSKTSHWTEEE